MEEPIVKKKFDKKAYAKQYRENNKEKIKRYRENNPEYNKEYRKQNLDKIKSLFKKTVTCECGKNVQQYYIDTHRECGPHIKAMIKLKNPTIN